jgi:isopentenyl diphosphate isomerase/L-lactate dehydrogenase-like FMN-dependent dehydrogenase
VPCNHERYTPSIWESYIEAIARELLPQMTYDYYASGANAEITLRENRAAYERITRLPRMLVDVGVRHMGTTVLGEPVSMPILIAPTALPGLAHPEGEIATTRAAGAAKTLITLATLSTSSIEEAMAVSGEAGVKFVLEMLRQEFDLAMALSGCPSLTVITRDLVRPL